jgi:hypothetical protein
MRRIIFFTALSALTFAPERTATRDLGGEVYVVYDVSAGISAYNLTAGRPGDIIFAGPPEAFGIPYRAAKRLHDGVRLFCWHGPRPLRLPVQCEVRK